MTPDLEIVTKRLTEAGVPAYATAGIVANLAHESEGNASAVGDGGTSIGLAQWHGPRAVALMDYADSQGASPKDPNLQADFLLRELDDHPDLIERMAKAGNAAGAADVFQRVYEKPKEIDPERSVTAVAVQDWMQRKGLDPQGLASTQVPMGGSGKPVASAAPKPVEEPGFLSRVEQGAQEGFGAGPIGPSPETMALASKFGPLAEQIVRSGGTAADLLSRLVSGAIGGVGAGVGAAAQSAGLATPTESQQLERDVRGMGEMAATAAPLASPTGLAYVPKVPAGTAVVGKEPSIPSEVSAPAPAVPEVPAVPPEAPAAAPPAMLTPEALAAVKTGTPIDPLAEQVTIPNLSRITTTDEAKNLITETAQIYQPLIDDARRGVVTLAATRQLADQVGTTPEQLVAGWKKGSVLNAEEMLAARDTLVSSAEAVMAKAKEAAAQGPDSTASSDLYEMLNGHRAIQGVVQGYTAEAGRLLNQFNIMSQDGRARIVQDAIDSSGGQWDEIVKRLAAAKPDELAGVVRELPKATTMDKLYYAWINGLLSSPITHMANILGNTASMLNSVVESAVAEALPGRGVRFGETAARAGGMLRGALEGLGAAYDALQRGTLGPSKSEATTGLQGALKFVMPTQWLGAEDAFFKSIAYRSEIAAQAVRQAKAEGLRGADLSARISDLKRFPTDDIKAAAEKYADYQTFQTELGKVGKDVQALRRDMPGGRWIVPFLKTPANLIKYSAERSPFGMLRLASPTKYGLTTTAAKQDVIARSVIGSTIGLIASDMAAQGKLTGAGPSDPGERGVWLEDHQPFSFKWGDKWISYDRLDPLSLTLGDAADLVYLADHAGKEDTLEKMATDVAGAIARNLTSKTWLQGPVSWLMALADPERYGAQPIDAMATSMVPNIAGFAARMFDVNAKGEQIARPTENIFEAVQSRIPGLREQLPESIGVLGRTITTKPAIAAIFPTKEKPAAVDPVAEAMRQAEFFPKRPTGKFSLFKQDFELTGEDLAQLRRDVGSTFRQAAAQVISNPDWFKLSPDAQHSLLERAHSLALEQAKVAYIKRQLAPERAAQAKAARQGAVLWQKEFAKSQSGKP